MIPILLISKNTKYTEKYVVDLAKEKKISPAFIFRVKPEPSIITIEQIREIKSLLSRSAGERIMIVVFAFDSAKTESQNAFLKTLEEEGPKAQFVLEVARESQITATILSRCKVIYLKDKEKTKPSTLNLSLSNPLFQNLSAASLIKKDKADAICVELISLIREEMKKKAILPNTNFSLYPAVLKDCLQTRNYILKNNLNPQLGIDHMLISIAKLSS